MNEKLMDMVLEQIVRDVQAGDLTAIWELIADLSGDKAQHFLSENFNQEDDANVLPR
jgi:hypothetical protein